MFSISAWKRRASWSHKWVISSQKRSNTSTDCHRETLSMLAKVFLTRKTPRSTISCSARRTWTWHFPFSTKWSGRHLCYKSTPWVRAIVEAWLVHANSSITDLSIEFSSIIVGLTMKSFLTFLKAWTNSKISNQSSTKWTLLVSSLCKTYAHSYWNAYPII